MTSRCTFEYDANDEVAAVRTAAMDLRGVAGRSLSLSGHIREVIEAMAASAVGQVEATGFFERHGCPAGSTSRTVRFEQPKPLSGYGLNQAWDYYSQVSMLERLDSHRRDVANARFGSWNEPMPGAVALDWIEAHGRPGEYEKATEHLAGVCASHAAIRSGTSRPAAALMSEVESYLASLGTGSSHAYRIRKRMPESIANHKRFAMEQVAQSEGRGILTLGGDDLEAWATS